MNIKDLRGGIGADRTRAFILGNGPSVTNLDLSFLKDEISFGMNASPILEERFNFTSPYYVLSDARFSRNSERRNLAYRRVQDRRARIARNEVWDIDPPSIREKTYYIEALGRDGFSMDLTRGYYHGCTSVMLALHAAAYVGARQIYLIGVDLRYDLSLKRFYAEDRPQEIDDFAGVQIRNIWNASRVLAERGVSVASCSPISVLNAYIPFVPVSTLTN